MRDRWLRQAGSAIGFTLKYHVTSSIPVALRTRRRLLVDLREVAGNPYSCPAFIDSLAMSLTEYEVEFGTLDVIAGIVVENEILESCKSELLAEIMAIESATLSMHLEDAPVK